MLCKTIIFILLARSVVSRNVPRFTELDEEDQHLFRAAYDTPSYDHEDYQEDDDMTLGKLDLLKDGLWAVKAKLKELKAFNKALVANLLSTKLKVKELLANSITTVKKHHHTDVDKKKPNYNTYSYQAPPPSYPQYNQQPQYNNPEYAEPHYAPPQHTHDPYYGH